MSLTAIDGRPRILVAVDATAAPGQWSPYAVDYARAIDLAGGLAIPIHHSDLKSGNGIAPHDGLLTIGGVDVAPSLYGAAPDPHLGPTDSARDAAELALTRSALEDGRPLLAICRGAQLLNVACGGSLLQHIEPSSPHLGEQASGGTGWHRVDVTAGSLLARLSGPGPLQVNSRHHQAITPELLAPGLLEAGRTAEGGVVVLEAIEVRGHPFGLGVQWHPERLEMADNPTLAVASVNLFSAFIAASATWARASR